MSRLAHCSLIAAAIFATLNSRPVHQQNGKPLLYRKSPAILERGVKDWIRTSAWPEEKLTELEKKVKDEMDKADADDASSSKKKWLKLQAAIEGAQMAIKTRDKLIEDDDDAGKNEKAIKEAKVKVKSQLVAVNRLVKKTGWGRHVKTAAKLSGGIIGGAAIGLGAYKVGQVKGVGNLLNGVGGGGAAGAGGLGADLLKKLGGLSGGPGNAKQQPKRKRAPSSGGFPSWGWLVLILLVFSALGLLAYLYRGPIFGLDDEAWDDDGEEETTMTTTHRGNKRKGRGSKKKKKKRGNKKRARS